MATMNAHGGKIAIIGSGLIGRSWAILFANSGYNVALYDIEATQLESALSDIWQQMTELEADGLLRGTLPAKEQFKLVRGFTEMAEAVKGAAHVQECVPESRDIKRQVFLKLDELADEHTVLASSTSAMPGSTFTAHMTTRKSNFIIAHPINPPLHMPLVELVPAPWTAPEVVTRTRKLMKDIGQTPITLKKEVTGFIQPRIQFALVQECLKLVINDVISVEDVDKILTEGLGMRYSFMGPFETIHLNAEGVNNYCDRYTDMIYRVACDSGPMINLAQDPRMRTVVEQLEDLCPLDKLQEKRQWRDKAIASLAKIRRDLDNSEKDMKA